MAWQDKQAVLRTGLHDYAEKLGGVVKCATVESTGRKFKSDAAGSPAGRRGGGRAHTKWGVPKMSRRFRSAHSPLLRVHSNLHSSFPHGPRAMGNVFAWISRCAHIRLFGSLTVMFRLRDFFAFGRRFPSLTSQVTHTRHLSSRMPLSIWFRRLSLPFYFLYSSLQLVLEARDGARHYRLAERWQVHVCASHHARRVCRRCARRTHVVFCATRINCSFHDRSKNIYNILNCVLNTRALDLNFTIRDYFFLLFLPFFYGPGRHDSDDRLQHAQNHKEQGGNQIVGSRRAAEIPRHVGALLPRRSGHHVCRRRFLTKRQCHRSHFL
jgi:hypothetical protein